MLDFYELDPEGPPRIEELQVMLIIPGPSNSLFSPRLSHGDFSCFEEPKSLCESKKHLWCSHNSNGTCNCCYLSHQKRLVTPLGADLVLSYLSAVMLSHSSSLLFQISQSAKV